MKTLQEIQYTIRNIINDYPVMEDRFREIYNAGYTNIHYAYVKNTSGLMSTQHLRKKHLYRVQISHTERKKNYPAAWVVDLPDTIPSYVEMPF